MENLDRMIKLYLDWASTQSASKNNKVKSILENSIKETSKFTNIFKEMGEDGNKMRTIFEDVWEDVSNNKTVAKRKIAEQLLEADEKKDSLKIDKAGNFFGEFTQSYVPIVDRTNQMQSNITDGDRDILIQIRYAITSGNYEIAQALILNFWGRLSIKERVDIMTWAMNIGNYNSLVDVASSKGVNFKSLKDKIEKKEITKEEFTSTFLRTAKEKMKAE